MKVSVIIPTYNRENFICQAIESVLQQTMTDIEIIVVDDGSTDSTREILQPYKETISYIYTKNGGPAHARNVGLKNAKGEYIAFLDSDDIYYPYKIELQSKFLDKFNDVGMVYTEFSGFDDCGFFDEFHLKKYHSSAYKIKKVNYGAIFDEIEDFQVIGLSLEKYPDRKLYLGNIFNSYFQHIIVFTNSIMLRKSILKTVGLMNEKYFLFDDVDFALRICKRYKVGFVDIPTYKLRYHERQISGIYKKTGVYVTIEKQSNIIEIAENHAVKDNEYYQKNYARVNKRMAILHKALAIPLLAMGRDPKRARVNLKKCAGYGYPEPLLIMLSYFPYIIRRIALKIVRTIQSN